MSPAIPGQSLPFYGFPFWKFKKARAAGKGRAWRAPPGVWPGCGAGHIPTLPSAVAPAPASAPRCCRAQAGRRRWLHTHVPGERALSQPLLTRLAPARSPQRPTRPTLSASLASPPQLPRPGAASENRTAQQDCGRLPGGRTSAAGPLLTWLWAWRGSVTAPGGSFAAQCLLKGARKGVPEAPASSRNRSPTDIVHGVFLACHLL